MIQAPADLLDFHPTLRLIRHEGACRDTDQPDDFFPKGQASSHLPVNEFCRGCPVRFECLEWAIDHKETGIWGGTTDFERGQIRRRRP